MGVWRSVGVVMTCALGASGAAAQRAPGGPWLQYASPEEAGFSAASLDRARGYADSVRSGAVMAIYRGRVLAAWGDVARRLELHSVRKSVVSALYGDAVNRGQIDLEITLAGVGIEDREPLSDRERSAKVRDLLAARSGVYLPAAYAGSEQDRERPARGSHAPGTAFVYNNWDFNVLGVIYERLTSTGLYDAFTRRIAEPLGMEDWRPTDGFLVYEPSNSSHPAHTFRLSARDLARFGQLWLQDGVWSGRRVLPEGWVERASAPVSDLGPGESTQAYGMMWWVYGPGYLPGDRYPHAGRLERIVQGRGTGGQVVQVVPELDLVYVHRGDTDHGREVPGRDAWGIFEQVLAARAANPSEADPSAGATPLAPVALESQLPPLDWPEPVVLSAAERERLVGRYEIAPGVAAEVYEHPDHPGRLFGFFPGKGEAELFAVSPTELFVRVQAGVRLHFDPEAGTARFDLGGQVIPARKLPG